MEPSLPSDTQDGQYQACVDVLNAADGLLITAGAGMGVDSGLPDFRGPGGFWKHYPALEQARIRFHDIASPQAFFENPRRAWGFYGHRLQLYRHTRPNDGFAILHRLAARMAHGDLVFTSNVDGQFQKAGYADGSVVEVHGSIHRLQCLQRCTHRVWPAAAFQPEVDTARCELLSPLPTCPHCGSIARPNVLMFDDYGFVDSDVMQKRRYLERWLQRVQRPAIIEIGAGTDIATVRRFSQSVAGTLIRINPMEPQIGRRGDIAVRASGLEALQRLQTLMFAQSER